MIPTTVEAMRDALKLYLVQRAIFCPITGAVLDVRSCGVFVDGDGDPAYVVSPEAFAAILATPSALESLAAQGLTPAGGAA